MNPDREQTRRDARLTRSQALTLLHQAEARFAKEHALVEDDEAVRRVTAICREIDPEFEKEGGSTRHWVRDFFLPALAAEGLALTVWEQE